MLRHQFFKQDPLVRSMLVNEIQSIGTFGDKIRRADLANEAQERNSRWEALHMAEFEVTGNCEVGDWRSDISD